MDVTASSSNYCYNLFLEFDIVNASFYHVGISSSCQGMRMYKFGFSRIIYDKTAIEALGYNYFNYGKLNSYYSNSSSLEVTLDPLFL